MRNYEFLGQTLEPLNLTNPRIQTFLFPGKRYKLPEKHPIIKRLVKHNLLKDLGEVKVKKKKKKTVVPIKTETTILTDN
ncbi:MAG: hypothetical protein AAGA60_20005 [Cyanobacteria bacterium P01_E01_bin.42]